MDIANLNKPVDLTPGEWIDDIPDNPGLRLKVRSVNYKPYRVASTAVARSRGKQLRTDEGIVDFSAATGKPLAEHILIDWEGVESNGAAVPYSKDVAITVLTSDDGHGIGAGFRRAVEYAAEQVAERLASATTEAVGN